MIYPLVVLVVASGVVTLMTIWIIPMFASLLRDIAGPDGRACPLPSRILMAFSDFVQTAGWWLIPLVLVGAPVVLFWFYRTPAGQAADRPDRAAESRSSASSCGSSTRPGSPGRCRPCSDAGVDVGSSLDLTADVDAASTRSAGPSATRRSMVMNGAELSAALDETGRFGPDVIAVVNSGEETGKLPETLDHLADDYEEQVAYMVRNMGQLVQPLLMILHGRDRPVHHPGRLPAVHLASSPASCERCH